MRDRFWHALAGPARLRDILIVVACALLSAGLIFGLLYDVFDGALRRWTEHDLNRRAHAVAAAVSLRGEVPRAIDEGVVVCNASGALVSSTPRASGLDCRSALVRDAARSSTKTARGTIAHRDVVVSAHPLRDGSQMFVVQDRSFLDVRRKHVLAVLFGSLSLALLALLLFARFGARIGSRRTEEEARAVIAELKNRRSERGAARLRSFVESEIASGGLIVIANREPYAHELDADGNVVVKQPPSGLVTAMEPVLRACGGTWIAYGGGAADRAHSDRNGRLAVPPANPEYTLRRVWIEQPEYDAYYAGVANDALWPLCHAAYAKPEFRAADWHAYQNVNRTFASAALHESNVESDADGMLLIQDYHFALVPRIVRNHAPHLVTSLFWHIPWPSAETIRICPWKETLLEGMTGADVVGFHTRAYCLNFLESMQRFMECRVDFDEMSVTMHGHRTLVRAFPISVEWPYPAASRDEGAALRDSLGIRRDVHVSVGVDRADYTKGLLERVAAVERLLEINRSLIGRYVLVQLAAPTRTGIRKYQQLTADLEEAVERVNARFGTATWKPIVLQLRSFSPDEVRRHYAMADSALVTPLHDGMNLVAKEYAAACADGNGVLVLSCFTGAAHELEGALFVNPYDADEVAEAILRAVRMPLAERRARMQAMRDQIASSSIYDWSEQLLAAMRDARERRARFWPRRTRGGDNEREVVAG